MFELHEDMRLDQNRDVDAGPSSSGYLLECGCRSVFLMGRMEIWVLLRVDRGMYGDEDVASGLLRMYIERHGCWPRISTVLVYRKRRRTVRRQVRQS